MSEALWFDLDQWQIDHLTAAVGSGSAYSSLQIATIRATIVKDTREWENSELWTLPAVVVEGRDVERRIKAHGDGRPHYDVLYPYVWLAPSYGTHDQARQNAKILLARLELAAIDLIAEATPPPPDSRGARLITPELGRGYVRLYQTNPTDRADWWLAVAMLDLSFRTFI